MLTCHHLRWSALLSEETQSLSWFIMQLSDLERRGKKGEKRVPILLFLSHACIYYMVFLWNENSESEVILNAEKSIQLYAKSCCLCGIFHLFVWKFTCMFLQDERILFLFLFALLLEMNSANFFSWIAKYSSGEFLHDLHANDFIRTGWWIATNVVSLFYNCMREVSVLIKTDKCNRSEAAHWSFITLVI